MKHIATIRVDNKAFAAQFQLTILHKDTRSVWICSGTGTLDTLNGCQLQATLMSNSFFDQLQAPTLTRLARCAQAFNRHVIRNIR